MKLHALRKNRLKSVFSMSKTETLIAIELTSLTDSRVSMGYNDRLSNNRALATAKYIYRRVTHPERLTVKGAGEKKLFNDCACKGEVKSDCSEEEHQLNRRTEFTIVKM